MSLWSQKIPEIVQIDIDSKELSQQRSILVYTPIYYDSETLSAYEVIYVFDAQSREFFDFVHAMIGFLPTNGQKYIVVGITSPYIESLDYSRNNDMLPKPLHEDPKTFYNGYSGNADNFLGYVKNEVIPYIDSNYRTKHGRLAVGHSLSASFIVYSMFKEPNLFDGYFAISPNFAFDKERLVDEFKQFDYQKLNHKNFLYLSSADEGINYWEHWLPARNKVYEFLRSDNAPKNLTTIIKEFPEEGHWPTFPPSLIYGMRAYFKISDEFATPLSKDTYEVTLNLTVPNSDDEVYIAGNQEALGNWDPKAVKMEKSSDFQRTITLKLHSPAELKFTRGSWETEGSIKLNEGSGNLYIKPENSTSFDFEIANWADSEN